MCYNKHCYVCGTAKWVLIKIIRTINIKNNNKLHAIDPFFIEIHLTRTINFDTNVNFGDTNRFFIVFLQFLLHQRLNIGIGNAVTLLNVM